MFHPIQFSIKKFRSQFILENRDIEKSWPKSLPNPNYVRHNTDCSDIEYTCPNYWSRWVRPAHYPGERRPFYQEPEPRKRDYRCTNPLDPTYQVSMKPISSVNAVWTEEAHQPQPKAELRTLGTIPGRVGKTMSLLLLIHICMLAWLEKSQQAENTRLNNKSSNYTLIQPAPYYIMITSF